MEKFVCSKLVSIKGNWERVSLTEDEMAKAIDDLTQINLEILKSITQRVGITGLQKEETIKLLFEREGVSSYTYLGNVLDYKIDRLKSAKKPEIEMKKPENTTKEEEEPEDPFSGKGLNDEYEEIKLPKEKKKGIF